MTDRLKKSLNDILCIAAQAREALEKDTAPDLVQKLRDFADDEQKRADFFQVQESKALDEARAGLEKLAQAARTFIGHLDWHAGQLFLGRAGTEADAVEALHALRYALPVLADEAQGASNEVEKGATREALGRLAFEAHTPGCVWGAYDEATKERYRRVAEAVAGVAQAAHAQERDKALRQLAEARQAAQVALGVAERGREDRATPTPRDAGRFVVRENRSTGELTLYVESGGSWLNPELKRAGFGHGDVVVLVEVGGDTAPLGTALPAAPDLPRAIRLLITRPAPTHETIQRLFRWIGGIPVGETHRVLMDLCNTGHIVNRGLPWGYRLGDEAAVHAEPPAPLGTAPGGYEVPTPIAPEQVERVETAPSWARAWVACQGMWAAYTAPSVRFDDPLYAAAKAVDELICKGTSLTRSAETAHAAIDALEKAARDANLWEQVPAGFWDCLLPPTDPDAYLTPFACSILAQRAATPRPDPVPGDKRTQMTEPTEYTTKATKETP